ncbi:hypothetical protein D5085_05595 [Ectothiorhodospiraceae bacterium BW-2]|nr:hypothetical protein D5085_05595 [Ectothiorhodospiraceae bacterium BW-2]
MAIEVEQVDNLYRLGQRALTQQLPILLMVSASHCGYCVRVEREFVRPLLLSGEYDDKIIVAKLELDTTPTLIDFQAQSVDSQRFSRRYRAYVTPTLLFLDSHGRELSEKLIGLMTPELFGGYIDAAIEEAQQRLGL